MERFGLSVELFVIVFSFLFWLVTPPTREESKGVDSQKSEKYFDLSPIFEELVEVREDEEEEIDLPSTQTGKTYELQEELRASVDKKLCLLKVAQVREIAGILGLSIRNGKKRATKPQLAEIIKNFLNSVELPESKVLQIQQYF